MSTESIVTLIVGIASPVATIIVAMLNIKKATKKMTEDIDQKQNEIIMMSLRNNIQGVYAMYRGQREMPLTVYQSVCEMYDQYITLGGNSYIKELKHEMDNFQKI